MVRRRSPGRGRRCGSSRWRPWNSVTRSCLPSPCRRGLRKARPADIGSDEPATVSVVSVLGGEEEDQAPAPLRDPIGVHGFPWEWVLPITGALLPLLAGVAWWWRGRGRSVMAGGSALPPYGRTRDSGGGTRQRVGREPADGDLRSAGGRPPALSRTTHRRTRRGDDLVRAETAGPSTGDGRRTTQRLVQQVMGVADGIRFGRRPSTDDELRGAIDQRPGRGPNGGEPFFDEARGERDRCGGGT